MQDHSAMKIGTDAVLLGAWTNASGAENILDIGTGTGIIAMMLAQKNATAKITAIEIDQLSAEEAGVNFMLSPFADRLSVKHVAVQHFKTDTKFDLIVSNPPYFEQSLLSGNTTRDRARHTFDLSFEQLAQQSAALLSETGRISLVLPALSEERIKAVFSVYGFYPGQICRVRTFESGPAVRILISFSKEANRPAEEQLILKNENGEATAAYRILAKDFYPHF